MCFASTLSYPQKEFLNPHPQQVQPAPHSHAKQSGSPQATHPRGLTRPAQDSSSYTI